MTMGTQILGVTSDPAAAEYYAHLFYHYDPRLVKKYEPVYASVEGYPRPHLLTSVEYTAEEQRLLKSYQFTGLGRFHFLVRPAPEEGDITGELLPVSIAGFDADSIPMKSW